MNILVIDGQGGQIVKSILANYKEATLLVL